MTMERGGGGEFGKSMPGKLSGLGFATTSSALNFKFPGKKFFKALLSLFLFFSHYFFSLSTVPSLFSLSLSLFVPLVFFF